MIYKHIDEYFSALIFCNHPLLPITLRHHQPTKISHFMKHLIKLPFIALLLSALCIASCSSDTDEILEENNDVTTIEPRIISSDNNSEDELSDTIYWKSIDENCEEASFIPITMLDSAEFFNRIKNVKFIKLTISRSASDDIISFRRDGSQYEARIEFRGFFVRYYTSYIYQFPTYMKAYKAGYQCRKDEHYGACYGHAKSDSEVYVCLDIVQKVGDRQYEYAYTVGLEALIYNKKFRFNPIGGL